MLPSCSHVSRAHIIGSACGHLQELPYSLQNLVQFYTSTKRLKLEGSPADREWLTSLAKLDQSPGVDKLRELFGYHMKGKYSIPASDTYKLACECQYFFFMILPKPLALIETRYRADAITLKGFGKQGGQPEWEIEFPTPASRHGMEDAVLGQSKL